MPSTGYHWYLSRLVSVLVSATRFDNAPQSGAYYYPAAPTPQPKAAPVPGGLSISALVS